MESDPSVPPPLVPASADPPPLPLDATLGGYLRVHDRPPAFEGLDGHPYSVSLEVERVGSLVAPWHAFLVFPRWAATGLGIIGHVETPTVAEASSEEAARAALHALPLSRVRELLDEGVRRLQAEGRDGSGVA